MVARRETGRSGADCFGVLDAIAFDGDLDTAYLLLLRAVCGTDLEVCRFAVFGDSVDGNEENSSGAFGLGGTTRGEAVGEPGDLFCAAAFL
jgi:hypothetical protein